MLYSKDSEETTNQQESWVLSGFTHTQNGHAENIISPWKQLWSGVKGKNLLLCHHVTIRNKGKYIIFVISLWICFAHFYLMGRGSKKKRDGSLLCNISVKWMKERRIFKLILDCFHKVDFCRQGKYKIKSFFLHITPPLRRRGCMLGR